MTGFHAVGARRPGGGAGRPRSALLYRNAVDVAVESSLARTLCAIAGLAPDSAGIDDALLAVAPAAVGSMPGCVLAEVRRSPARLGMTARAGPVPVRPGEVMYAAAVPMCAAGPVLVGVLTLYYLDRDIAAAATADLAVLHADYTDGDAVRPDASGADGDARSSRPLLAAVAASMTAHSLIGQAVGVLAGREGRTPARALELLHTMADDARQTLTETAHGLCATDSGRRTPGSPPPVRRAKRRF
ncbi:MAG: ANTAR domain-containing protein [Mycobacteriales bacterium]